MYDELVKRLRYCQNNAAIITDDELMSVANDAADAIEELSKPRWIPVTERLPNGNGEYLVSGKDKIWVCEFRILGDVGGWCNSARNPCVKYWMPLPSTEGLNET